MAPIETIVTPFVSAQAAASVRVLILGLPRGISRIVSSIASYLVGGRVGMDENVFGIYT